jgi:mycothiol synthase
MTRIIHPQKTDLDRVFQFMTDCDMEEFGEIDSSREDLEGQWDDVDLQNDVWIACGNEGNLQAYSSVSGQRERQIVEIYLFYKLFPVGLEDEMIKRCLARTSEIKKETCLEKMTVIGYASATNPRLHQLFTRYGFLPKTYHYRMQIDIKQSIEKPEWSKEYALSTYTEDDDDELYKLITEAFDWEGHVTPSIDAWRGLIFRGGRYDPEYFVLVREGGRLVAAALAYAEETGGWIRQLAVAKDHQGKGLGGQLLRYMFWKFAEAGLKNCALGVASANSNACQFYERNGMHKTRQFTEFNLEINSRKLSNSYLDG